MLIKHLKNAYFMMARAVKKPSASIPDAQDSQIKLSIKTPKFNKQQRENERYEQEEDKRGQQLIRGFEQYKQAIEKQRYLNRGGLSKQQFKKNKIDSQIQLLEIPESFKQRLYQSQASKTTNSNELNPQIGNSQQQQLQFKPFKPKSQQQVEYIKNLSKIDPFLEVKLKQEALISHIEKQSKQSKQSNQKEVKLNHPKQIQQQLINNQKLKKKDEEMYNEVIRYEKLSQSIKNSRQANQKVNMLSINKKIQIDEDQIWRKKYSPELIQKALNYKNKQLNYFKELIQPSKRPQRDLKMLTGVKTKLQKEDNTGFQSQKELKRLQRSSEVTVKVQQEGVTQFRDQDYYREKGLKQFELSQNLMEYDKKLINQGKKDLLKGNKTSSVILDDYFDYDQGKLHKKQMYDKSTFGIYDKKLKNISQKMTKLGIDFDIQDLEVLNKEDLFAQKKLRQQQIQYQQYLLKKQRKKKMDTEIKKIHKQKLRDDLNYENQTDPINLKGVSPIQVDEGIIRMEEMKKQKQSKIITDEKRKQQIHYIKTLKKMNDFINGYFYQNLFNPNNNIRQFAEIRNLVANKKNTVLNIFWKLNVHYLKTMNEANFTQIQIQNERKNIQKRLDQQSGYISGKMTQALGLRYGPDIRFHYQKLFSQTEEAYQQMKKYKDQIIELEVQDYQKKGLIKNKQQEEAYRKKLEGIASFNIQDMNNRKQLLTRGFRKRTKIEQKRQRRQQKLGKSTSKNKIKSEDDIKLQKIITQKQNKQKQSMFSSPQTTEYVQEKNEPILKKKKVESSARLWDQIDKL